MVTAYAEIILWESYWSEMVLDVFDLVGLILNKVLLVV